jgi:hypothetical protein
MGTGVYFTTKDTKVHEGTGGEKMGSTSWCPPARVAPEITYLLVEPDSIGEFALADSSPRESANFLP